MSDDHRTADPHWLFVLRAYQETVQGDRRDVVRQPLTPRELGERQIIGGALLRWFRDDLPVLQSNRAMLSALDPYPPHPLLLITTTPVGLQAVSSVLQPHPRLFAFTEDEWAHLPPQAQPPAKATIRYFSRFGPPSPELWPLIEPHAPGRSPETLAVHQVGHRFNERAGNDAWHLWHWQEGGYRLLRENLKKAIH